MGMNYEAWLMLILMFSNGAKYFFFFNFLLIKKLGLNLIFEQCC